MEVKQRAVTIMIKVKTVDRGWVRYKPGTTDNNQIAPGVAIVDGKKVQFKQYSYDLQYYLGGKTKYKGQGRGCKGLIGKMRKLQDQLTSGQQATKTGLTVEPIDATKLTVRAAIQALIDKKTAAHASPITIRKYKELLTVALKAFKGKPYMDGIKQADIYHFRDIARKGLKKRSRPLEEVSVNGYQMKLKSVFIHHQLDHTFFPPQPVLPDKIPDKYTRDDLTKIYAASTDEEAFMWDMLSMVGFRCGELTHVEWTDINWDAPHTVKIQSKPHLNWFVKGKKARVLPICDTLFATLTKRYIALGKPTGRIIDFIEPGEDSSILRRLKKLQYKAGISCGFCTVCLKSKELNQKSIRRGCRYYTLHKFRRTFLSNALMVADIRTVKDLAGHARLATTERYLAPMSTGETLAKLNTLDQVQKQPTAAPTPPPAPVENHQSIPGVDLSVIAAQLAAGGMPAEQVLETILALSKGQQESRPKLTLVA